MRHIDSYKLKLAFSQLAFILMLSLPLLTFPANSIYPRYTPDMMAFSLLAVWGLLTLSHKENRQPYVAINSLGLLALAWTGIVLIQQLSGLINTYWSFTLISLGYFFAMAVIGVLVHAWIRAGYKKEIFYSFLIAILLVALLNACVVLIQSSRFIDIFIPVIEKSSTGRPGGFISQANIASTWLVCGLIALVFLTKNNDRRTAQPNVLNVGFMCLLLWAINTTASRISLVEIYSFTALLFFMRKKMAVSKVWLLIPLWQIIMNYIEYFAGALFEAKTGTGIFTRFFESQQTRFEIFSGVIHIIKEHPLGGIGWRQLQLEQLSRPDLLGILDHSHNLILQIQLELGLAGSVSLAAFLMYWLFQKSIWSTPDPVKAVGLMIAIVFGLHSMTEFPLWHGPSLFAFCVSIALIETSPVLQIKTKPKVLLSVLIIQCLILAWISLDHTKAYEKLDHFTQNKTVTDTEEMFPVWWFKTYDDYREIQAIVITPQNHGQYRAQTLQLANGLTPAIPYLHLLKVYVFSNDIDKAHGMARRICKIDPQYWQKIVAYHLLNGPKEMQTWIFELPPDIKKCTKSEVQP